jgi:hypothetical protein
MVVQLVNKLNELNCEFVQTLKIKVDETNYGLKSCSSDNMSEMDKNPKYQKLKNDFIKHYNKFNSHQLDALKNQCDVLNIIKRL